MQEKSNNRMNKSIMRRTLFLMIVCGIVAFIPLVKNLYSLQITNHDKYESMAVKNQTKVTTVSASRGSIYDRNMDVLAVSSSVCNIYLDPQLIRETEEEKKIDQVSVIASGLTEILGADQEKIKEMCSDVSQRYKVVARRVEQNVADQVREFIDINNITGVGVEPDTKRYYPSSTLASQVIGFVGTDNEGLNGVEYAYDDELTGTAGKIITAKSNDGTEMQYRYEKYYDADDGNSLVLTIDSTVQSFLEKNMQEAIENYDVQNGAFGVIMNVNTGEILAMATLGNYDPNNYNVIYDEATAELVSQIEDDDERSQAQMEALLKQWRNRVVSDGYEPGSTFKTITLAAALEEGAVDLNSSFYCGGTTTIKGRETGNPLHCWKAAGHGAINTAQALQGSCNIAFADIGIRLGAAKLYEYVKAFGLMEKTGIDLPGEASGIFFSYDILDDPNSYASLASASFGQTFKITPIQLVTAISAVVNGGNLMQPYVVSQVLDETGAIVSETEPTVVRQAISQQTSETMCTLLQSVVEEGTASGAKVVGYKVGGKTGTSEKIDVFDENGQLVEDKIVSFVGIAPIDDPQYICLVALDTPSQETGLYISGGIMAAPTVRAVLEDILPYLGVEAHYTEEELKYVDTVVPYVVGLTEAEAAKVLADSGFEYRTVGEGSVVTDQTPAAASEVPQSAKIVLYMGEEKPADTVTVPEVVGYSIEDVKYIMTFNPSLYLKVVGSTETTNGIIYSTKQTPEAGTEVERGAVITVEFIDINNQD